MNVNVAHSQVALNSGRKCDGVRSVRRTVESITKMGKMEGRDPAPTTVLSIVNDSASALQARLDIGNGLTVAEVQRDNVAGQSERLDQLRLDCVAVLSRPHHR